MKREPSLKLARSPLILVLAQVKFSPILKVSDFVPDIQEVMRGRELTRYSGQKAQQVSFGPDLKAESIQRWVFSSRDQREAVILANDFVVYETSNYEVFGTFWDRFREILEVIKSKVKIDFAEQIGLRYVDLVRPADGRDASEFLRESIRGLSGEALNLDDSRLRHKFLIQAETGHGTLLVKSFENYGKDFMSPDLDPSDLRFPVEPSDDEVYRILDFDHIYRGEINFDPDAIEDKLWALHAVTSKAFLAMVTEEAIEYWKGEEIQCPAQ